MKLVTPPRRVSPPPTVLELPFPRPPLTTNESRSGTNHWSHDHRAKILVEQAVITLAKAHRVPHYDRCRITLRWHAPDNIERDCGSLWFMLKAAIDGLTPARAPSPVKPGKKRGAPGKNGAGVIDGDHAGIVVRETCEIIQGDPPARMFLIIEPA